MAPHSQRNDADNTGDLNDLLLKGAEFGFDRGGERSDHAELRTHPSGKGHGATMSR
jgi:hypothetical protein